MLTPNPSVLRNVFRVILMGSIVWPSHTMLPAQTSQADETEHSTQDMDVEHHHEHTSAAIESMTPQHQHMGPHMKWTTLRPANPEDAKRAEQVVQTLRETLAKYKDSRAAIAEGYEPHHLKVPQPHYHFTSKARWFKAAFRFDPSEPAALLYKKTENGYELEGAMYTAPKAMSEDRLNERVPLSVAQWHAHVNICLPPQGVKRRVAWTKFGFKGSIATEQECQQAGGRFYPQIYGWMLHVYPFEQSPEKIWTH